MATARPFSAPNPSGCDRVVQGIAKATSLPQLTPKPDWDIPLQRTTSKTTTLSFPPDDTTNWDEIDPVTGLSKEYMTAIEIIDSCDNEELRRFNAPLLANHTISIGQQIEIYYRIGESAEHRRQRKEKTMTGKRTSVAEEVAAVVAFWRKAKVVDESTEKE